MKKMTLLFGCFLFLTVPLMAQSGEETTVIPDARIYEIYSEERVQTLVDNKPEIIRYWNYFLDHSYLVEDIPDEKTYNYPDLKSVAKLDRTSNLAFDVSVEEASLNVLLFDPKIPQDKSIIYRLGDTGKIIVFFSKKEFQAAYNATLTGTSTE